MRRPATVGPPIAARLVNGGWRVLRFTGADLEFRSTAVVAEIQGMLSKAA